MDSNDLSQPTQATQNVIDPRRLGQQNSGFSDEDISDIICILVPYSEGARRELKRIAEENNTQHMVTRDDTDELDLDYQLDDDAQNFGLVQQDVGQHHIALRFSAQVKSPLQGFTFGRNTTRCDICLKHDPARRLSNIHFRIYLNEHEVLMLEDQSTNGTIVDDHLLKSKANPPLPTKRTLTSGSKIKILMHTHADDITFLVRVPRREGRYHAAYQRNLEMYMRRQAQLADDANATIVPGPGGHVDIFKVPVRQPPVTTWAVARWPEVQNPPAQARPSATRLPRSWNGSDKYNRVGEIGKGAFATVYKVTSKFDGLPYAAKELDKTKFMRNGVLDQKVENEMKIMQKVKHPNIVQYVEHLDWDDRLMIIIMEFIPGGDLGKMINEFGPLPEMESRTVAQQLLSAIGYLHDMNITHRDVKPDNILVSSREPFVVKLTDFGLSKMIENEETFLRTFCGTLLYCAPEVYSEYTEYDEYGRRHGRRYRQPPGQRYDHAVDIWSLGGVLFYILTQKPPFPAKNGASHSELLHQIMTRPLNTNPLYEVDVSDLGVDFLSRMLDRRPESRANVETLQNHPWISSLGLSQSSDEISDEELRIEASQLSLIDREKTVELDDVLIPRSDDEIIDDDEVNDENHFSGYESEKENYTFGPGNNGNQANQPQRLFGEVNASAIGSSGVIPVNRLNLPVSATTSATTEILGGVTEIRDSFDSSDDSLTPRDRSQKSQAHSDLRASVLLASQSRSVEEINNMTFNIESQSLGGAESFLEHLNVKSRGGSLLRQGNNDLNTSKRKQSVDSSGEIETPATVDRRVLKRLRSEGSVDVPSSPAIDEADYELLARMPPISRASPDRQIDIPVHKSTYWIAQDRSTWHTRYPEMTQLQFDAFKNAASARSEDFGPGKTALWDLAVKYFPPICYRELEARGLLPRRRTSDGDAMPSTAVVDTHDPDTFPDTQDPNRVTMPAYQDPFENRIVAVLQSAPGSAVSDMAVSVTEAMVSFGRGTDNTRSYSPKTEAKVPKYAFKLILWKDDFDPCRNFRPWTRGPDMDDCYFYISTKASHGIYVNGKHLPSVNCRNPAAPAAYWMRLQDNDSVVVWQTSDGLSKAELTFRCDWGGSAQPHPEGEEPAFASEATARQLDEICPRLERKMRNITEHDEKMDDANHDYDARVLQISRERDQSRLFELKRQEAIRAVRRGSPGNYGAYNGESSAAGGRLSSLPGGRSVPFRTASPGMLRGARR